MPINPTYPGVYIEELPSPVRTITGVSTSITSFIGRALRGPADKSTLISSFAEFERIFGGLWKKSSMSFAVQQYFLNGGRDALIVRVHNGATRAKFEGNSSLKFEAANEGEWSKGLFLELKNAEKDVKEELDDQTLFNLAIKEKISDTEVTYENLMNLSTVKESPRFVALVLQEDSQLIRVPDPNIVPTGNIQDGKFTYVSNSSSDGNIVTNKQILGEVDKKIGMYALEKADLFNILCIPPYNNIDTIDGDIYPAALKYCEDKRAIFLLDPPAQWKSKYDVINNIDSIPKSKNGAIYYPRIISRDPIDDKLRVFAPCGAVAGILARTDSERGVWKAPAGIEATLNGVEDLAERLTDDENGKLNPLGVNCLRILPLAGRVVWGARTMRGADRLADQWKYLPIRRLALYIEESLYRGTQWVVFEPNDEPLWSQIRLNVGAFMHDLFRKGAFQGGTPKDAYLVKVDKETTTQLDIDRGIVNIVVGFAPLKPAEFVIIQIKQLAGQPEVA